MSSNATTVPAGPAGDSSEPVFTPEKKGCISAGARGGRTQASDQLKACGRTRQRGVLDTGSAKAVRRAVEVACSAQNQAVHVAAPGQESHRPRAIRSCTRQRGCQRSPPVSLRLQTLDIEVDVAQSRHRGISAQSAAPHRTPYRRLLVGHSRSAEQGSFSGHSSPQQLFGYRFRTDDHMQVLTDKTAHAPTPAFGLPSICTIGVTEPEIRTSGPLRPVLTGRAPPGQNNPGESREVRPL